MTTEEKEITYEDWLVHQTVILNPYIKEDPSDKQNLALQHKEKELFFGGAAGGGKSSFLLMAALQFVQIKGYSAIIFRRTFQDLQKPGALIPRSFDWLSNTDAKWNATTKSWIFPSGAILVFAHMEHEKDRYNYQGGDYNFIGFDELPHFEEVQYRYLFSRLRKDVKSIIPSRIRSTGNPDGVGFEWVRDRFTLGDHPERPFIPSMLEDNPFLNLKDYEESLKVLDYVTYQKLRFGDWRIRAEGAFFKGSQIEIVEEFDEDNCVDIIRRWDLAATPESGLNPDPDFTVGAKIAIANGYCYILDIIRGRWEPAEVDRRMLQAAQLDGRHVRIICEEEGGSGGKRTTEALRNLLKGYSFTGVRTTGKKEMNARPFASWVNQGKVKMKRGKWNEGLLNEFSIFPTGSHDDQVDACSHGYTDLASVPMDVPYTSTGFSSFQDEMSEVF